MLGIDEQNYLVLCGVEFLMFLFLYQIVFDRFKDRLCFQRALAFIFYIIFASSTGLLLIINACECITSVDALPMVVQ